MDKSLLRASLYLSTVLALTASNKQVINVETRTVPAKTYLINITHLETSAVSDGSWIFENGSWYYRYSDGSNCIGLVNINGQTYYLNDSGVMCTGWVNLGEWYYFQGNGAAVKNAWVGNYYLGSDGKMLRNRWINQYYVGSDGAWVPSAQEWNWVKEGNNWKYQSSKNGNCATNEWKLINQKWYYFDKNSIMVTGLRDIAGQTYYLDNSGAMRTGWINLGEWYYFQGNGAAVKNAWVGNYYLGSDGKMQRNQWINQYYVGNDGAWVPSAQEWNWVKEGNNWKYQSSKIGQCVTNSWKSINGKWYYFDGNGIMLTGLREIAGQTYYLDNSGAMRTGWMNLGEWYYFQGNGSAVKNAWVGNYYLGPDGKMLRNQWINQYYVGSDGAWVPSATEWNWVKEGNDWKYHSTKTGQCVTNSWKAINGKWYYFDDNGIMVTGNRDIDGSTYFFESSGAMVSNKWVGNYFYYADGRLAKDTWVGNYYVDESGKWVPNATDWQWKRSGDNWTYKNTRNGDYARDCWINDNGSWYYLDNQGYMLKNSRVGDYFCGSDGRMATTNVIYNGYYYHINANGYITSCSKSLYGIDISQWNGDIDLSAYKDGFVIFRAGYGWSASNEDTYLRKNIEKCNALGIPYGIYWYSYATDTSYARKEADVFLQILRSSGANPTLGVWMDVENDSYKETRMTWNHSTLDPIVKTFCDTLANNGYKIGVYANYNDFESNISTGYPKWVAHWGSNNDGTIGKDLSNYGAAIHQYSSNNSLDKNIIYDMSYFE